MPAFAIPRFIEFLPALPMTENGKVQKFRLRERGVTTTTWDRNTAQQTAGSNPIAALP
jgi:crotonobetaine/carnitine-CoA ligase